MKRIVYYLLALAGTLAVAAPVAAQNDPSANLVHSYTFEDGTADDQAGSAHGALVDGAMIADGSLVLAGGGQHMEMPAATIAINGFSEATLEILYTPTMGANTGYTMLAYFGATNAATDLGIDYYFMSTARGDDVSRTAISIDAEEEPWLAEAGVSGTEYDDGQLHHMVSTLSGSEIGFYLDGELVGTADLEDPHRIGGISTSSAYLGRGGYTADPSWIGSIHAFNVYDRVLTADEIASLYDTATPIDEVGALPGTFGLSQNHPNPFSRSTTIAYAVSERSAVEVAVYDLLGHRVATLVDEEKAPGSYEVNLEAGELASGVYLCTMHAGSFRDTMKLVLLRD